MDPRQPRPLVAAAALSILSGLLVLSLPARAMVLEALPLRELTRRVDLVVHGEVLGQTTRRESDGHTLWTRTRVRIVETFKGSCPAGELTFDQLGGTLDGLTELIPGDASFQPGEEVVVFLARTPKGFVLYGFSEGKFTVGYDPVLGSPLVRRDLSNVGLVTRGGQPLPASYAPARLEDFRAEIRSYANR